AVDPAVEYLSAVVDVLRISAVRRVEFGRHGELAAPQHPLQPAARAVAGQGLQRQVDACGVLVSLGNAWRGHAALPALAASFSAAARAVTRSQAEVSRSDWSTGFCTARMAS